MMNESLKIILFFVLIILIAFATMMVSGCSMLGGSSTSDPVQNLTAGQSIAKAIEHTNWLVTLAIIGAGAGFFAFLNGNGIGLKLIASCLVIISLTLMISWAAKWIACIGIAGSIGLLIYTIWTKNKAIKEVVEGNEKLKQEGNYSTVAKEVVEDFKKHQKDVQSPSTRKIVGNILKKLGV